MSRDDQKTLPNGWTFATIADLVGFDGVFCDGDWVETKDQDPQGDVRLIQLADVGDGNYRDRSNRFLTLEKANELRCTLLKAGDLLIARMPDPLGRACSFPGDTKQSVTVVDVCIVRFESPVRSRWVMHQINTPQIRRAIAELQSGTTRRRISRANLATVAIPIPPLAEQERITAQLDELLSDLDAGIKALGSVRAKLRQYRAAVLKAAVEGTLTAEWRNANPDIEPASELLKRILAERRRRWEDAQLKKYKDVGKEPPKNWKAKYRVPKSPNPAQLRDIPDRWTWATPNAIGKVQLGRQRAPQHHSGAHMRPYLRVANVYEGRIDLGSVYEMNFTPEEYEWYRLEPGDLLLNEGQSLELVGRSAIYRGEVPGACFTNTLVRFRPAEGVAAEFAQIYFSACLRAHRFQKLARWTVNIAHLGADRFAEMEFPVPPLAEQSAIVQLVEEQLSVIDHLEADLEAKLKSAPALRQSILKTAFEGKLVPQDPKEEPAGELLKRIADERAERERLAKKVKKVAKSAKVRGSKRGQNMSVVSAG